MSGRLIVVTGSTGFIGTNLVEALVKNGDKVIGYDNLSRGQASVKNLTQTRAPREMYDFVVGDILDFKRLKSVIKDGVDVVYHLAALPSHRLALERPHEYTMVDIVGTGNVLEAARICKNKPIVVFASSNKVYGKQPPPWREDKLVLPEGPYAVAKSASEQLCEMYAKYFDVPCVVPRFHHVAGPRSHPDLALSIFVEAALAHKEVNVHGKFDKKQFTSCSADYTHVNDAIRATLLMVDKYKGFEIFNVANKKLTTVEYIAQRVANRLYPQLKINQIQMMSHETLVHHSDVSKAKDLLGFEAEIPVETAIDDYIDWRIAQDI